MLEIASEFLDLLGSAELFWEYNGGAGLSCKKRKKYITSHYCI